VPVTDPTLSYAPTVGLADGTWYWRVKVLDAAGNELVTSSSRSFVKDGTKPTATPTSSLVMSALTSPITVSFSEPVARCVRQHPVPRSDRLDDSCRRHGQLDVDDRDVHADQPAGPG
jgi:hypothetical protein